MLQVSESYSEYYGLNPQTHVTLDLMSKRDTLAKPLETAVCVTSVYTLGVRV